MKEDELIPSASSENESNETDYIATIQELKATTVSKEAYMKLKDENKKLIKSLVNGDSYSTEKAVKPRRTEEELKTSLRNANLSNLEYIETALELREAVIARGGEDPFTGGKIADAEKAAQVAQVFQECVDVANGDSGVFTAELMRRTKDDNPSLRQRLAQLYPGGN